MKMQIFGTLRLSTNRALLVGGNIPENFSKCVSPDIDLLFGVGFTPDATVPSQFLRLEPLSDESAINLFDAAGELITILGDLTEMSVFDAKAREIRDPLLRVRSFARHETIAVRAFAISQTNPCAAPVDNWLRLAEWDSSKRR